MNYSQAHEYLYSDGSLRDVYAHNLSLDQLDRFLDIVRPMLKENSFTIDGRVTELPNAYEDILKKRNKESPILSIPVGDSILNCHFFTDHELELDLQPKDYDDERNWNALSEFLSHLSKELNVELILTPENMSKTVYIRFDPEAEPGDGINSVTSLRDSTT